MLILIHALIKVDEQHFFWLQLVHCKLQSKDQKRLWFCLSTPTLCTFHRRQLQFSAQWPRSESQWFPSICPSLCQFCYTWAFFRQVKIGSQFYCVCKKPCWMNTESMHTELVLSHSPHWLPSLSSLLIEFTCYDVP